MAAPAQRLLNCSEQKQLDNSGDSQIQSGNSNLQNGSSNEDINSEDVSGNVILTSNRGKPRANNCGQNRDMKMDNFQDGGPQLSGRPNAANPDQMGFTSTVERTRMSSEFPNFNQNPREQMMVADEYRNSQELANHAVVASYGYERSGYPAEQHGGQPLPANTADGAMQANSQQNSKMFSQYQQSTIRAGFQPNPRGPSPRSSNPGSGMPPVMNYSPNSQQRFLGGGQSISQQGGPTPTLNQLLQAPNPLQRFQNNYGDYNSNQGMHKDVNPGLSGHSQYPGSSTSPHGWSPTRGMSYQQQMAGMGANYRGQNVPIQGPVGDPSIKRPPYMSPGGPQGGGVNTPPAQGAPSPASSPQIGQFGQPPQQYPQRQYSQQQHRGPHNQNYPSPQMSGSPYGMHGTGASSGASSASQSGNNYEHQRSQANQPQSHQQNFQQTSGNNQSPQRENSSSNLEEHSSDSNSNSGQGGQSGGGGPGGRSSTPGSRTSGTPPSASVSASQQQSAGSQGGGGPGGGSQQQQQQQQSGSSQQGNSGSQSQNSNAQTQQQQQLGNGNSATSGNGNSNNGGNLQQGVSPLRPVPSPSGSSGSRSMSPAIGQQQNIPMPPRPSSSQSDSIAPNTMSQTALPIPPTGYGNAQMAPPMYGNKMGQGLMGSSGGVQLNSYPQQGSHYTQGNYRNQNSMMMQGYGQGPVNFGSPTGHGGGGYSSSMMGVRMSSNSNTQPTGQNFGGYHNSQYNNTTGPNSGYGMNNMMPPPSQYPKSPGGLNSQVGAQAAAQAAVIAAASSATLRSSPMYIRHQLQQKMYGGSYNSMHPQVPNSQQGPGVSSGGPHPMGNLLPHPPGSSPNMPCQPDGISGAPPSVSAPSSSHSVGGGSSSTNVNMENSIATMDNSGNTSTSVTQSISSPVPAVSMMVSSPSMSNMVDLQSQSQQHQGMGGGGPPQIMGGVGSQGGGRVPGGSLQSLPPPILDEASQASNASATSSLPDDRSETPKPNSKTSMSHPPTPNTLPSPGAASMSSFHEEFDNVSSPSWPRTPSSPVVNNQAYDHHPIKRPDGLLKLYDMSDDPDRRNFLDKLIMYSEERGTPISQCPTISKQPLDLYRLYMAVKERGGFVEVTKAKHWKDVAGLLGIGASSSAAYTLRKQYIKHLLPFECKFDRGGIDPNPIIQQVETSSRKKGAKNQPVCPDPFPPASNQSLDGYPPSNYPGGYGPGPPGHHQMMNSEYPPPSVGPHMPPYQQGPPAPHHQGPPPPPQPPSSHIHGPGVPNHMSPSNNVPPTVPTSSTGPDNIHMTDPYSEDIQTSQYQRHTNTDGYSGYGPTPSGSTMMPSYSSTQSSMSGGSFGFSSNSNVGSVSTTPVSGHQPPPEQVYGNSGEQYPHHPGAAPPPPSSSEAPGYGGRNAVPDPYGLPPGSYPPNRTIGGLPNAAPYPYQSQYDRERYESSQTGGMIRPPSQPNAMLTASQSEHQMYPQTRYGPGPGGQAMSTGSTGRETAATSVPPPAQATAPPQPANTYPANRTGPMAQPAYPPTPQPTGQPTYPPPPGPPADSYNRVPDGYQGYPPNQPTLYGQATVPPNKVAPPGASREPFPREMFAGGPKRHPDFMKSQMGPSEQYPPVAGYGQQPNTPGYPDRNQYPPYRPTHMGMPPPTAGPGQPAWTRDNQCRPYSSSNQSQYSPGMRESWDSSRTNEGQSSTPGPWQGRYGNNSESYGVNSTSGASRGGMKMPPYNRDRNMYMQPNKTHPGMSQSSQPYPIQPQKKELVFAPDTVEGVRPVLVKKRKLQAKDVSPVEAWRLMMAIKSGLLAESTWALDVLSVLLYDDNTVLYFGLCHLPGLMEALLDHYRRCLNIIFGLTEDVEIGYELHKLKNQDSKEISDLKNKEQQTWPWFQTERDAEKDQRDSLGSIASIDPCDKTVFLNTENYSFKTRCNKVVRCRTAETLFLIDPDKKWDCSEGFTSGADHWMLGGGDTSSYIQTHFENTYKLTKFARVMENVNKENVEGSDTEDGEDCVNGARNGEDKESKRLRDSVAKREEGKERVNNSTVVIPKKLLSVLNSKRNAISLDGLNLKELKEISSQDKDEKPKTLVETEVLSSERDTDVIVKKEVPEPPEESLLQNGKEEGTPPLLNETEKSQKESSSTTPVTETDVELKANQLDDKESSDVDKEIPYPRKRPFPRSSSGERVNMDEVEDECYNRDEPSLCTLTPAQDSLARRCISISSLLRNFSFVPGNDSEMAKHAGFLLIMGRVLLLHHSHGAKKAPQHHYEKEEEVTVAAPECRNKNAADNRNLGANGENASINQSADSCSSLLAEKEWWWDLLHHLRENTLVTLANISGHLDLTPYPEEISLPILDGLLHWAVCPSSYAQDPLPNLPTYSVLSPQRLSLEALCKLSTMDSNVDLLLATPPWPRIERLFAFMSRSLSKNEDQVMREFSVVLLSNLAQADSGVARAIALQGSCISQLITFVEQAEQSALQVANSQGINALRENPELMGTTLDMVRRAAATLRCLAAVPENRALFLQHQQRLLTLVMSQILDQGVASLVADVLYECSKKVPDFRKVVSSSSTTAETTALTDGMT